MRAGLEAEIEVHVVLEREPVSSIARGFCLRHIYFCQASMSAHPEEHLAFDQAHSPIEEVRTERRQSSGKDHDPRGCWQECGLDRRRLCLVTKELKGGEFRV